MFRLFAILHDGMNYGMDETMNYAGNNIPIVQVSTSWRERCNGYSAELAGGRIRAWLMILAGFLIGIAVDVCIFDESLLSILARSLA